MTGPLPVTARLDEAFRSIAALQRHPGFFISLRGSTSLYNVFASPARYRREDADPFTPPFTPPRGRPRRRRARAPHLPLSEFANMGNDDQILVEIELKWTDVVLGAVRHVLSLRRSQFFERVRVQAHTGQPFELSSTSTNRIRSGGCGTCRRPLRSRSRHAPTTPPRAQKPAPKQTAQLAYCSGASPVDAGSGGARSTRY